MIYAEFLEQTKQNTDDDIIPNDNPSSEEYYDDDTLNFDIYQDDQEYYQPTYDDLENDGIKEQSSLLEVGSISYGANTGNTGINFQKEPKRTEKTITDKKDLEEILSITHDKAAEKSTVMDYFANFGDGPRFQPYWLIEVPANTYGGYSKINKEYTTSTKKNKEKFTTTIGLWIFNKAFIEPFSDILGYINEPVTADVYGSINQQISYALLEDKITVKQLKEFINQTQIMMSCCSALASSHTNSMFTINEQMQKKKAELHKKYGDKLNPDNPDLDVAKKYEEELINFAKETLKDDPAVDMFNSGARSSWGNNYKNMYVTRGPIRATDGSYSFVDNAYIDGLNPEDFVKVADGAIQGPYAKSKLTASGGYVEKLFTNATQHIKVLGKGTDCKTKHYIEVELTKGNIKDWQFSYMIGSGGQLIELLPENAAKYIGKKVKMRYSAMCHSKNGICEACAGTFFRRVGIENIGMATMVGASSIKNSNMKKFHDATLKLIHIDPHKLFS